LVNTIQQNTILSGSTDRLIRLWDIETGELKKFYSGHTRSIKCLEVLSKRFFASGSNDTTIKIWHLKTGKCVKTLAEHENSVWCLKKLNDHQFSSGSQDQSIKIWSSFGNEIKCVKTFHVDFGIITRLEMIESLNFLVSSSMVIHVWDLNTYQCVWRLTPNENSKVRYFQILPNNRIISSQKNNTLEIFCLNTGKSLRVLKDIEANFIETIV
jgi:WD40 repeat protein